MASRTFRKSTTAVVADNDVGSHCVRARYFPQQVESVVDDVMIIIYQTLPSVSALGVGLVGGVGCVGARAAVGVGE
jgi:hypothetical protein